MSKELKWWSNLSIKDKLFYLKQYSIKVALEDITIKEVTIMYNLELIN